MQNPDPEIVAARELQPGALAYIDTHVPVLDAEGHPVGRTEWVGLATVKGVEVEGEHVRAWVVPDDAPGSMVYVKLDADHQVTVRSW